VQRRVATFNIRHGARSDDTIDHAALADACAAFRADVIGLQEVDARRARSSFRDQGRVVARRLGCNCVYGAARRRREGFFGNALLSTASFRDVTHVRLPRPSEREARAAILARLVFDDGEMSVAVTHLQHQPASRPEAPPEAPLQLRALLDAFDAWPLPRVVMGDFNMQPPRAHPILSDAGYAAATTAATVPADEPRITLDYVAVCGVDIVDCVVVAADVSDHRAIIATLRC
jgi:endonuclease/exonuclease/phosphatase family metal-dependent hydrolase